MEQDIQQFLEFTGGQCDRKTAQDFLQGNDSVMSAVQAWWDDPSPLKWKEARTWTESSFGAERNGGQSQMDSLPPFQMEEDDRAGRILRPLGAPSRPPSRERSRISLRSGRDVDMQQYGPHQQEEMDPEMAEAMRLSLEDAQQSGVIDASGKEYVPDLEPVERKRQPGEPAFFKPLPNARFLPSLLMILHSIPQCREALLCRHVLLHDYGESKHWWEGEAIEMMRIEDMEETDSRMEQMDVIHETQRLMAFLDRTERSYGSVGALSQLPALQFNESASFAKDPSFVHFLTTWQSAATKASAACRYESLFQSIIKGETEMESQDAYYLDVPETALSKESDTTLYDTLDRCFSQGTSDRRLPPESFLEQVAPIVLMRIASRNQISSTRKLIIPATLWADRYLHSNQVIVKEMRAKLEEGRTIVEGLEQKLGDIKTFQRRPPGTTGDASMLLDAAITHVEQRSKMDDEQFLQADGDTSGEVKTVASLSPLQVLARLQAMNKQLRAQVESLNSDKELAQATLLKLSKLLTDPDDKNSPTPTREYRLCGVGIETSNQSHTTYVRYQSTARSFVDASAPIPAWWRITYDTAAEKALVTKEEVIETTMLEAAGELRSDTLLVYATIEMFESTEEESLPSALEEFVHADNRIFHAELEEHKPQVIEGQVVESVGQHDGSDPSIDSDVHAAPEAVMISHATKDAQATVNPRLLGQMQEMEEMRGHGALVPWHEDKHTDSDTATIGTDDVEMKDD